MRVQGTTLAFCLLLGGLVAAPEGVAVAQQRSGQAHKVAKPARHAMAAAQAPHRATARKARPVRSTSVAAASASHRRSGSYHRGATASYGGGISCVPYARMVTGMQVSGNGGDWGYNAAGTYDRG